MLASLIGISILMIRLGLVKKQDYSKNRRPIPEKYTSEARHKVYWRHKERKEYQNHLITIFGRIRETRADSPYCAIKIIGDVTDYAENVP